MKGLMKLTTIAALIFTLLASAGPAFAQDDPAIAPRPGGGIRGEVTARGAGSLTVAVRNGENVTVHVTEDTRVHIFGSGQGELADIEVGNFVGARGPRNDDGSIQARVIVVFPEDPRKLDRVRGKVTEINGAVIVVENRSGTQQITTNADTKFRVGREEASLDDIKVDHLVLALGNRQDDSTFVAKLVIATTAEQLRQHTLRGKVSDVDTDKGTLTVEALGDKEGSWTVQTTDQTRYRIPNVENPTLADVPVGAHVVVLGKPAGDDSQSSLARLIAVIPEKARGRVGGEVTAIIDDTSFTLKSRHRGDFTILTDDSTQYRTRGDQDVSFEDIQAGTEVIVIGKPVEGQEKTIQAKIVGIKPDSQAEE